MLEPCSGALGSGKVFSIIRDALLRENVRGTQMQTLRECLKRADDDYLAGLSNKGTVKRAAKDLEKETPKVSWTGEEEGGGAQEAEVAFKEETCRIRVPLGESTCTCPSRSICRHVTAAILWLRREQEQEGTEAGNAGQENGDGGEPALKTTLPDASGQLPETNVLELSSLFEIPLARLIRAAQGPGLKALLAYVGRGDLPSFKESSVVSVRLPWSGETVSLLEPVEYSSCTCKSRSLCAHKAQAILLYQLAKKRLDPGSLFAACQKTDSAAYDRDQMREAVRAVLASIEEQLSIGLSRQSADIPEHLERLAVICHRAALPRFASGLRTAAAQYRGYFSRSAVFRDDKLLKSLLSLSRLGKELLKALPPEDESPASGAQKAKGPAPAQGAAPSSSLAALAGSFRSSYEPVGTLHLLGMGVRAFLGQSGYEGETYYFLEPDQKKWYVYTDARPVFYEGVRKRGRKAQEGPAPWGLPGSREALCEYEFRLTGAKAAPGGRLSASQETKGEILGRRTLSRAIEMSFWDYSALLAHFFAVPEAPIPAAPSGNPVPLPDPAVGAVRERLALVGAVRWGDTSFDAVKQRFSWSLYDAAGRELRIAVSYTEKDGLLISLLERIGKKLAKHPPDCLLFLGNVYLGDGRLCLYPIECFLSETDEIARLMKTPGQTPKEAGESGKEASEPSTPGPQTRGAAALSPGKAPGQAAPPSAIQTMAQYIREGRRLLTDLFVSGLSSVPEEALEMLSALAREGERLGLHRAGKDFTALEQLLSAKRHEMAFSPEPVIRLMEYLDQYMTICQNKLSYDNACQHMSGQ